MAIESFTEYSHVFSQITDRVSQFPENAPDCNEGQKYRDANCEDCGIDIHLINEHVETLGGSQVYISNSNR